MVKNSPAIQETCRRHGFDSWVKKIPWRRKWQPTPVFLPGKSHEQRSLAGYSSLAHKESDKTKRLTIKTEVGCKEAYGVCVHSHSKEKGEHKKNKRAKTCR